MVRTKASKKKKPGPKGKYNDGILPVTLDLIGKFGARNQDLADYFGVSIKTIEHWIRNNPLFAETVRKGRVLKGLKVAESLYAKANGFEYYETVVTSRTVKKYHPNGKPKETIIEPVEVQVLKKLPPDPWACIKILTTLHKPIWADVSKHQIDYNYSGEVIHKNVNEISLDSLPMEIQKAVFNYDLKQLKDAQVN